VPAASTHPAALAEQLTLSIVSHGHGELLLQLLGDLDQLPGIQGTRVVVTLNLPDEVLDPIRFPSLALTIVRNARPKGFGANHNQAFAHCRTPWFAMLNPDLRINDPACLGTLLAVAGTDDRLALLAPRIVNSVGREEDALRCNLTLPSLLTRRRQPADSRSVSGTPSVRGGPFYWIAGMFMMVRATAFRQVGGFDERFFLYCEDYDLCARLYVEGHAVLQVPQTSVVHDAQRDSHRSWRYLRLHIDSLVKVWTSSVFWRVCRTELRA
jgi:hypothetical protein